MDSELGGDTWIGLHSFKAMIKYQSQSKGNNSRQDRRELLTFSFWKWEGIGFRKAG